MSSHYTKILIAPSMMFCEMMTGGYYMETLKIMKQSSNATYPGIMRYLWGRHRFRGFYLGLVPWGLIQTSRGLPVLFVQSEMKEVFENNTDWKDMKINLLSGVTGGMVQGFFVTPTQRLKTLMMTYPKTNKYISSFSVAKEAIRKDGIKTLFRGLKPMILRRGIDWGLRFASFNFLQDKMREYRKRTKLSIPETFLCGFGGGVMSSVTAPIDTCVAESQKYSNRRGFSGVIKDIYNTYGLNGFIRGWRMRVLHSCYHTSWVCGMGSVVFSLIQ